MWSFYYRHLKQEAGRKQNELFGQSIITKLQGTLKSLWLQSLLLLLFCLDISCAPTESLRTGSLSHTGSLHVKSNFLVLNITHPTEMQNSVPQIPVWKPEPLKRGLRALRLHPMISVSSHKLYKHRLFKRNLEKLSQKNSTSLFELASTLTKIFMKMVNYEALYPWPDLQNTKSVVGSSNKRSLPDFPQEFLRTGPLNEPTPDHLLKVPDSATILHLDLSEAQTPPVTRGPLSEAQTPPVTRGPLSEAQTPPVTRGPLSEAQTPPVTRGPLSEAQTPPVTRGPLSEAQTPPVTRGPLSEAQTPPVTRGPLSEAQTPPVTRGPLSEAQTPPPRLNSTVSQMHDFSDEETSPSVGQMQSMLTHIMFAEAEDMSSTGSLNKQEQAAASDLKFLVQSENTLPSKLYPPYRNGGRITELNYTELLGSPFAVIDGAEILTETSAPQSATLNLKTSSSYANNGLDGVPNSSLKTVEQYSAIDELVTDRFNLLDASRHLKHETSTFGYLIPSQENSTISLQHKDISVTATSLTNSTLASSSVSVNTKLYSQNSKPSLSDLHTDLSDVYASFYLREEDNWDLEFTTPQALDIVRLTSSSTETDTVDTSDMHMQRIENSSVADGTWVGTFFASSNLIGHAEQDSFSAQTTPHASEIDQTSDHNRSLDQQGGTSRTFSTYILLPQNMSTAKMGDSTSWQPTVNTDFNTFSSVTQSPYQVKDKACVLQIHDPANTQMPKSSETLSLPTVYKSIENESDATEPSASISVTPNDGSTRVETTSTDAYSELAYQSTMTPFEHDVFNDVMNGNDIINQSTFNLTSKQNATMLSTWAKKFLTTVPSLWKSRTAQLLTSTVEHVQKVHTSQSTLYSTDVHNVSKSPNATGGQVHTFHKLSNVSLPGGTRALFDSTTMPTTLQWNISIKSVADMAVALVKTSTYKPSTNLVSKSLSDRNFQRTYNGTRQPQTVTATITNPYPNQNTVTSSSYSTHLKTQTASNTTKKPLITSTPTSRLTLSQSSKITPTNTLSTSIVTPAPKVWIPQAIFPLKPTITTPIKYSNGQSISSAPTTTEAVVTMPLNFHLIGVSFSEQLLNRTSEEYRKLQREIKLVMGKIFFAKYQSDYLETEIKAFLKGSVMVKSDIVFQSNSNVPSESDLIRTVLTDGTKTNYFGWSINGSTVELNGYTKSNLELEILPISFLVLHVGYIAVSQKNQEKQGFLNNLQKEVFYAVNKSFPITNVSILEIRDVFGDLKVRGNLYLNSTVHTNVQALMSSLLSLVNRNVDLSSIIVNDIGIELKVYSINFRVTNRNFGLSLLDMSSSESQLLSKDLSAVVQSVLQDSKPIQVVMREFKSGSVVCRGDLLYRLPAPSSKEILGLLLKTLGSDGSLAFSTYKVDFKSITIGDSSPGLPNEYVDFPGFGVAIIVMCGLCILIFPIILFVCTKTSMLGHRQKATIQRRHDPVDQSHHFEMDNQAFRASIEQP